MNNIRKIIEERLENARLDFNKTTREFNAELKGQIEAYQDCLNLFPQPRTEQEILNDFEELGWDVEDGYVNFTLKKITNEYGIFGERTWYCYISIDKDNQTYGAEKICCFTTTYYNLTMQEHKLLNELFTFWGWV